jgi:hypothetical protein
LVGAGLCPASFLTVCTWCTRSTWFGLTYQHSHAPLCIQMNIMLYGYSKDQDMQNDRNFELPHINISGLTVGKIVNREWRLNHYQYF